MQKRYTGSCHCGKVQFEVQLNLDHVRRCDCSICHKRGALNHRVPLDALTIKTPLAELTQYQWHTKTAEDYFCPVCGILPFRKPRGISNSEQESGIPKFNGWAINIRCLDEVNLADIPVKDIYGSKLS